jgi:hypothetical protein
MIWWKGKGLWLGIFVLAIIVAGGKAVGGKYGFPAGCAAAAVLTFVVSSLEGPDEEPSSLYSVPMRFWPYLLIAIGALGLLKG